MAVTFDVEPFRADRANDDDRPEIPCDVPGCNTILTTRDTYTLHQRKQHGIRRKPGRPARKDSAA